MATGKRLEVSELQDMLDSSPFHRLLGLKLEKADESTDTLRIRLPRNPQMERADKSGQHHGGVIASLIDIAGDFGVIWHLGYGVPTINFRTDYLRPAIETDLVATSIVRRIGKTVAVCDVEVTAENGKLLAIGRGTYSASKG